MQNVLFDLSQTKRKQKPKICCKGTTFYPNHQILENNFEGSLYPDACPTDYCWRRYEKKNGLTKYQPVFVISSKKFGKFRNYR